MKTPKYARCNRAGNKVIFKTELDAKLALAERVWKDKGEIRCYKCPHRNHWHLTSMTLEEYLQEQNRAA